MIPLSRRQLAILDEIRRFIRHHRRPPSVRELAAQVGRSCSTVHGHLNILEDKGLIARDGSAHGIHLVEHDHDTSASVSDSTVQVPLVGTIAAGEPLEALEERDDDPLILSSSMASTGCYALRVRGDSMVDDHILDGDIVIVHPHNRVDRGTVVVALLDDGTATLKRIYPEGDRIRLQPANGAMAPLYVASVRIQGCVVAVIRRH